LEIVEYYPWWFPLLLLANAMLAFVLNLSIVLLVTNVGIMVMTLAGIFKDVLVVTMSVFLFGAFSTVTTFQVVGYGISLVGLTLYKELKKPDGEVTLWLNRLAHTFEQAIRAEEEGRTTTSVTVEPVVTSSDGNSDTKRMNQKHGKKWVTRCMVIYKCVIAVTRWFSRICPRRRSTGLAEQELVEIQPTKRAQVANTKLRTGSSGSKEHMNYIYKTLDVNDEEGEDDLESCYSQNSPRRSPISNHNNHNMHDGSDEEEELDDSDLNDNPFAPNFKKMKEEEYARSMAADMIFDAESS